MNEIVSIILLPIAVGLLLLLVPDRLRTVKGIIALLVSIVTGYLAIIVYTNNIEAGTLSELTNGAGLSLLESIS
jgi:formate hydrogenlyase subunit 3/multisubunit Na+/H+ antiporter MnhD subunit